MSNIVILGAGLTGISAAYHLEQRGFHDYQMFEKEPQTGGLCRSVNVDGFTFDYTGHLLHINNDYFRSLIENLVGIEHLNSIDRKSFVFSNDVFTHYPFQINLHGLPTDVIVECIKGYVTRPKSKQHPKNFVQWVHQQFGKGFAKHFFIPFQHKLFAYDIRKISAAWTGRFVPKTSLTQMLYGALGNTASKSAGYNAHFYYPKHGGIQFWVNKLRDRIKKPINVNHCVKYIDMKNRQVVFENGHVESFKQLISTIPLDQFIKLLKEPTDTTFYQAHKQLRCNSVVNFNLGIKRPSLSDKHWIYFPEKKFPFYRIGFQHNFSSFAAPQGCSSLYGEFSYTHLSKKDIKNRLEQALNQTKKLFKLASSDILVEKIIHIPHAYVIFNHWREQHLPKLLKTLQGYDIHCVGRYGAWKYSSMQEAVLEGKEVAEQLTVIPAKKVYNVKQQKKPRPCQKSSYV